MKIFNNLFSQITSLENLFLAWEEFRKRKQKKSDVCSFEINAEQNIFKLHRELADKTYKHGPYTGFYINDPKRRHIHKAAIRDRMIQYAVYKQLDSIFDSIFISDSYASREGKGTHKAVLRLNRCLRRVSQNHTRVAYALKCDIKKFFDSIHHQKLFALIIKKVKDKKLLWLLWEIIDSFPRLSGNHTRERERE